MPGYYRFAVSPYLREIVDCLGVDSPVREVSVMKGVQIGYTSGVTENAIGYFISHVKTAPLMFVTADAELAQLRLDSYILPMLQNSNLVHLITSSDDGNTRKTGKTRKKLEWLGGGGWFRSGLRTPTNSARCQSAVSSKTRTTVGREQSAKTAIQKSWLRPERRPTRTQERSAAAQRHSSRVSAVSRKSSSKVTSVTTSSAA